MQNQPPPSTEAPESGFHPIPDLNESLILVRQAQAGDSDALNRLFERYYDRIYRIARIRMGAKLRTVLDSYDIVQETCAVAVRKIGDFKPQGHASLIQWLAQIAENQIHDAHDKWIKAQKRDRSRETPIHGGGAGDSASHAELQLSAGGLSPSSIVANSELKEIYDACVEALPEEYRELILLREYAGASWEEIAERADRPNVHASQEAYRRAQIKLAGLLRQRMRR